MKRGHTLKILLFPLFGALASCGGGDDQPFQVDDVGDTDFVPTTPPVGGGGGGGSSSSSGGGSSFLPASNFDGMCVNPRPGTQDVPGTTADQNNWLRSWTYDTYLWYSEVTYPDVAAFPTPTYFDMLKTSATTSTGKPKDRFHFTYDTAQWIAMSQVGTSAGYGADFEVLAPAPPRRIVVGYVQSSTPAAGLMQRGDEIITVDGVDVVNGSTQANVDAINGALFPDSINEQHSFVVRSSAGVQRSFLITSAAVTYDPVPAYTVLNTPTGNVGYIIFNEHNAPAEAGLINAVNYIRNIGVTDLIIDMRYNGGGYLDLASELAYMVANTTLTSGQTFERIQFNDKHPSVDPVTGQTIQPTPFHSTTQGFGVGTAGTPLPNLNLNRVYIITGSGTCSASESVINGLRGVNVQVSIIGSTTCGKPYGFYPTDNCGTTYFSIQFKGSNALGFGDYTDGFSPANTQGDKGTVVPGCSVADDFSHQLGDVNEGRLAAALAYRASNNQTCPAASGFTDPRLSKASFQGSTDRNLWVSKPAARMNRILRQ